VGGAPRGRGDATVRGRQGGRDHGLSPAGPGAAAKKIGHVVVDSTSDRPWSQHFCCMIVTARDFPEGYPVAAKRAVRAIMKANRSARRSQSASPGSSWTGAS